MSGKGSKRRPGKPGAYEDGWEFYHSQDRFRSMKTKKPDPNPIEYMIVSDQDSHKYVIRADEAATFVKWEHAMNGQRNFPQHFSPFRLDSISQLRFTGWREETTQ